MYKDSQQAVSESLATGKPLLVYVDEPGTDAFYRTRICGEVASPVTAGMVILRVDLGTPDYSNFQQLFTEIRVPSFNIINQGKVLDVMTADTDPAATQTRLLALARGVGSASLLSASTPTNGSSGSTVDSSSQLRGPIERSPRKEVKKARTGTKDETKEEKVKTNKEAEHVQKEPKKETKKMEETRKEKPTSNVPKERLNPATQSKPSSTPKPLRVQELKSGQTRTPLPVVAPKPRRMLATPTACVLSIKLFDGSSVRHEFAAEDTLGTVREWLDSQEEFEVIPDSELVPLFASPTHPTGYVFYRPAVPVVSYLRDQEAETLLSLDLCPRLALILKPLYLQTKPTLGQPGLLRSIGGSIMRVGLALYSFFDYGVDNTLDEDDFRLENPPDPSEGRQTPLMSIELDPNQLHQTTAASLRLPSRAGTPLGGQPALNHQTPNQLNRQQSFQSFHNQDDDGTDYFNGNSVNLHDDDKPK